ncbi:hypothetical protein BKA07_001463 [Brevibacterium marinum]|uniref:Uncharacterized protein n=1 Tax=Brevibacterium marinum TaxID=418643 RepID=A0A846S015_9MICO|nr:hypothetical protein [Brevibacterium marinum]
MAGARGSVGWSGDICYKTAEERTQVFSPEDCKHD